MLSSLSYLIEPEPSQTLSDQCKCSHATPHRAVNLSGQGSSLGSSSAAKTIIFPDAEREPRHLFARRKKIEHLRVTNECPIVVLRSCHPHVIIMGQNRSHAGEFTHRNNSEACEFIGENPVGRETQHFFGSCGPFGRRSKGSVSADSCPRSGKVADKNKRNFSENSTCTSKP